MTVNIGSQVEVKVDTGGFVIAEVTEITDESKLVGDKIFTAGEVVFNQDQISQVLEH